jgi:predicted peptidase
MLWGMALVLVALPLWAADDKDAAGKQQEKQFEKEVTAKVKLNYLLYLPDGYGKDDKAWPLLLFLHGAGETGNDLSMVKKHGPPKLVDAGKSYPFIIVSPQASRFGWDASTLGALVDDVASKYKVDKDRLYVTGLSMGGFGTWALAAAFPDKFAAIAPICGGGDPASARKLKNLPIWVFHGAKDRAVPLKSSETMVQALKDAGAAENVKFTIYPDAEHDSWTETYNNPELYEWFLKQKRSGAKKE